MLAKAHPRTEAPFTLELMGTILSEYVDYSQECMYIFLLDSADLIIDQHELYRGTHNNMNVSARDVCRFAVCQGADQVVLAHNHPDGGVSPSPYDIYVTALLSIALDVVDIKLKEHYIIGDININKEEGCRGIKDKYPDHIQDALKDIGLSIDMSTLCETSLGGLINE